MSTKRKAGLPFPQQNPLYLVAAKTTVPQEHADKIALIVLIALDAAKRGQAGNALANTLTLHLGTAQCLWAAMKNVPMYNRAIVAWKALCKASMRDPDIPLRLTTTEYADIRPAIGYYLRSMTKVQVGDLVRASQEAGQKLGAADVVHSEQTAAA